MEWTEIIDKSGEEYIYIINNKKPLFSFFENLLGYMPYVEKDSIEYFKNGNFKYKGEFFNEKESRFRKLKKLKNETI
jgi:hypothetical protein